MEPNKSTRRWKTIWNVVGGADRYIANQEPWSLKKTDPVRMEHRAVDTAELVRVIAILPRLSCPAAQANYWTSWP